MKNKIQDLRDHLFEQIERLKDADKPEEIEREISRAKAMGGIANQIIATAKAEIDFAKVTGQITAAGFIPTATAIPAAPPARPQIAAGGKPAR
jgi:hypothetical protein